MYDFFILFCWIGVINFVFGVPIIYCLQKKAHRDSNADLFRMLHSIGFDFTDEVKEQIKESDKKTNQIFIDFRFYLYDKFKQQLEDFEKVIIESETREEILKKLKEIENEYKNQEDT